MRKIRFLLFILPFMIPFIILSIVAWNDYADEIEDAQNHLSSVHDIFFLDQGQKVVSIADGEQGLQGIIYDARTHQMEKEIPLASDVFKDTEVAYQNNQLVVATKDDNDQLFIHVIDAKGNTKELAQQTISLNNYLNNSTYMWRNRLVFVSDDWADHGTAVYIAEMNNGQLTSVNMSNENLLPSRPIRLETVPDSFESNLAIPMFNVTLKDGRSVYTSGIFDAKHQLSIYTPTANQDHYEAEDQAQQQFITQFNTDPTRLLQVDSDYPKQVRFYNQRTDQEGTLLPTPQSVYQAQITLLNDEEVLVAGSTTEDEANGQLIGYIYNEKTKTFTDISPLLSNQTYDDLNNNHFKFYKESTRSLLYYSNTDASAGWFNTKDGSLSQVTTAEAEQWQSADPSYQKSWQGFQNYLLNGGAIVFNLLIWLLIPFILLALLIILPILLRRRKAIQLRDGIVVQGTIIARAETGTMVNDQPQVRFTVQFEDEGVLRKVNINKVVSYLHMPAIGDLAMISYNRQKQTAIFLTSEDVPAQPPTQIIYHAVLKKIDTHAQVNRGQALVLHFELDQQTYSIPVVQPHGFEYRLEYKANLIQIAGTTRLLSYSVLTDLNKDDEWTLQGEIIGIQPFPVYIDNRQLMLLEVLVTQGNQRIQKVSSQFVPSQLALSVGNQIPVNVKKNEFQRDLRLMQSKQGSAKVVSVDFKGTTGERPIARIIVERGGSEYVLEQSIEPVYGVEVGDELWIAYDEQTREAIIVKYASM